jgi:hypothetical protein
MLVALGSLASAQSTKTKATAQAIFQHSILELLLNTHIQMQYKHAVIQDAVLQYRASDTYLPPYPQQHLLSFGVSMTFNGQLSDVTCCCGGYWR